MTIATHRVDDLEMVVEQRGAGQPLLLVHGFPLARQMWREQLAGLSGQFRLIAPDLRGFGATTRGRRALSIAQLADDLAKMLDVLAIDGPVVYVGLSMGGYVAWQFWKRHAQRLSAMILCDTRAAPDSEEQVAGRRKTIETVRAEGIEPVERAMMPKLLAPQTPLEQPEVAEFMRSMIRATPAATMIDALEAMATREDARPWLEKISLPALCLVGEHDAISPPAEMGELAKALPRGELKIIPMAGHMAPLETPQPVNAAILEFVRRVL